MFKNLITKPIPYPMFLSKKAVSLLKALLQVDPVKRLGYGPQDAENIWLTKYFINFCIFSLSNIKKHDFFSGIEWDQLYDQTISPPIKINQKDI